MNNEKLIEKLQDLQQEYEKAAEKIGAPAFKEMAQKLFDEIPELDVIVWTQYAPHFNDGDACIFSVHEPAFHTLQTDEDSAPHQDENEEPIELEEDEELELSDLSSWEGNLEDEYELSKAQKKLLDEFSGFITGALGEDICERVFGECAKVVISRTKKGCSISSDYFDHD